MSREARAADVTMGLRGHHLGHLGVEGSLVRAQHAPASIESQGAEAGPRLESRVYRVQTHANPKPRNPKRLPIGSIVVPLWDYTI